MADATTSQATAMSQATATSQATTSSTASQSGSGIPGAPNLQVFDTTFAALNNSGVQGGAAVVFDSNAHTVTVEMDATGLEPNQVHPAHIHGFTDDSQAHSPILAQDTDHDGFVELAEGQASYGPILLNLTSPPTTPGPATGGTFGGTPNASNFPTADANGDLHFQQTYTFDPNDPNAQSLLSQIQDFSHKEIVIHGETVMAGQGAGTSGEVDGSAGYKAVLPVASGVLHDAGSIDGSIVVSDLSHDSQTGDHSLSDFLLGHV